MRYVQSVPTYVDSECVDTYMANRFINFIEI